MEVVAVGVHRVPEPFVDVDAELPVASQPLQGRELEEEVGVELLLRSYKGIEFTDAGHILLTRARLAMIEAVRIVVAAGLDVIGVTPVDELH